MLSVSTLTVVDNDQHYMNAHQMYLKSYMDIIYGIIYGHHIWDHIWDHMFVILWLQAFDYNHGMHSLAC